MAESRRVSDSIYTVLCFIAVAFLIGGLVFIIMRSNELFGTWNPLDAKELGMVVRSGFLS